MIHNPEDLQVGRIVHLHPHTKQASPACYRQLAVTVAKDPAAHWPRVLVTWKEGVQEYWELVHRDNIRLRRAGTTTTKEEVKEGDTTRDGGGMGRWAKVKKLPGRAVANLEDQMPLF